MKLTASKMIGVDYFYIALCHHSKPANYNNRHGHRERQTERQTDRQREREREREGSA